MILYVFALLRLRALPSLYQMLVFFFFSSPPSSSSFPPIAVLLFIVVCVFCLFLDRFLLHLDRTIGEKDDNDDAESRGDTRSFVRSIIHISWDNNDVHLRSITSKD